jgi:hypothetical protein
VQGGNSFRHRSAHSWGDVRPSRYLFTFVRCSHSQLLFVFLNPSVDHFLKALIRANVVILFEPFDLSLDGRYLFW